jgi:hypothetical protein
MQDAQALTQHQAQRQRSSASFLWQTMQATGHTALRELRMSRCDW